MGMVALTSVIPQSYGALHSPGQALCGYVAGRHHRERICARQNHRRIERRDRQVSAHEEVLPRHYSVWILHPIRNGLSARTVDVFARERGGVAVRMPAMHPAEFYVNT